MLNVKCQMSDVRNSKGIAVLPVMLLVGAIVIEIAIVGGILAFFSSSSNLAVRASQEAFYTARAGAEDALLRLVRNKDFIAPSPYTLSVGSGAATTTAEITVIQTGTIEDAGGAVIAITKRIVATSSVVGRTRIVEAIVSVDNITGKVDVTSLQEIE